MFFPKPVTSAHVLGAMVILLALWDFSRKHARPKAKMSPRVMEPDEESGGLGGVKGRPKRFDDFDTGPRGRTISEGHDSESSAQRGWAAQWIK